MCIVLKYTHTPAGVWNEPKWRTSIVSNFYSAPLCLEDALEDKLLRYIVSTVAKHQSWSAC